MKRAQVRRQRLAALTVAEPLPAPLARAGAFIRARVARLKVAKGLSGLDDETIGRRAVLGAAGAVMGPRMLPGTPFGRVALGAFLAVTLAAWLEGRDRDRSPEVVLAMPDVLDRLATCVLAGLSVERGLRLVAAGSAGPVGDALRLSVAVLDAGGSRREALDRLVHGPAGVAWAAPVAAIDRAERLGVPLADTLVEQAHEQRRAARALVEARVRSAPVKLVFPLVFCFLPAFLVLAVGPVALSAIRTLSAI